MVDTSGRIDELKMVFRENLGTYIGWLVANLGGLLVGYVAVLIVFIFHRELSPVAPGPEEFLITGAISIAISGASYLELRHVAPTRLVAPLLVSWPLLLAVVIGVLVTMGTKEPKLTGFWLWGAVSFILLLCLSLASIIWLHDRGIRLDHDLVPTPKEPSEALKTAAKELPKIGSHVDNNRE